MSAQATLKRTITGTVVSDKMDKTAVIKISRRFKYPLMGKFVTRTKKIQVHDQENRCNLGDLIMAEECRPLSKHKSWTLKEIVEKARS